MTIPVYAAGRTESSAPTKQNKNRAKRDVEDAVPYEAASTDIRMDGVRSPHRITDCQKSLSLRASPRREASALGVQTGVAIRFQNA